MLKRGEEIINLENPKTDIDRKVARRVKEIIETYKLDKGHKMLFRYPKRYLVPNKANGGKIDSPASFRIQFRDVMKEPTGAIEWRWYQSTTGSKDAGTLKYNPNHFFFTGTWSLGLNDVDLIYFLLDIYSRTENGANWNDTRPPYIALDDKIKEAAEFETDVKAELYIKTAIYGEAVGLDEKNLRLLGHMAGIVAYDTLDLSVLKKQLIINLTGNTSRAITLIEGLKKGDQNAENMVIVDELVKKELIQLRGVAKNRMWLTMGGEEIMRVVAGEKPESQLASLIGESEEIREKLTALLEA